MNTLSVQIEEWDLKSCMTVQSVSQMSKNTPRAPREGDPPWLAPPLFVSSFLSLSLFFPSHLLCLTKYSVILVMTDQIVMIHYMIYNNL